MNSDIAILHYSIVTFYTARHFLNQRWITMNYNDDCNRRMPYYININWRSFCVKRAIFFYKTFKYVRLFERFIGDWCY